MAGYSMSLALQTECCFRLVLSAACGLAIGYERTSRLKEAGIRTHIIVAIGAALMMQVSKYGFFDLSGISELIKFDPSRVAAQIVSGIGFLGAGMIFIRNRSITGLTTAAGIWTTAGIGMAIGAGLYVLGLCCTGLVLITQYWLHSSATLCAPDICSMTVRINEGSGNVQDVIELLQQLNVQTVELSMAHEKSGVVKLEIRMRLPKGMQRYELVEKLGQISFIAEVSD